MKELFKAKCCHFCTHFEKVSEDSRVGYYHKCKKRNERIQIYFVCDDFEIEKPKPESLKGGEK